MESSLEAPSPWRRRRPTSSTGVCPRAHRLRLQRRRSPTSRAANGLFDLMDADHDGVVTQQELVDKVLHDPRLLQLFSLIFFF